MPQFNALPRRERERLMRRNAMIEAARTVFAEKGYVHATLEEIAHTAEFGKGTIYNYFEGGKEDLLLSVLDMVFLRLQAITREVFAEDAGGERPFRQSLAAYITSLLNYFGNNRDLFLILVKEQHRRMFTEARETSEYFTKQNDRLIEVLGSAIEQAIARGELKALPARPLAHLVMGNIFGYLTFRICQCAPAGDRSSNGINSEQASEFLTVVLCDGMST